MSDTDLKEAMRNELARRQEAGHDARVPLVYDVRFKHLGDEQLAVAIRAYEAARGGEPVAYARQAAVDALLRGTSLWDTTLSSEANAAEGTTVPLYAAPQPSRDDLSGLFTVIADIREKTGVGQRPMLSELADAVAARCVQAPAPEGSDTNMQKVHNAPEAQNVPTLWQPLPATPKEG